MSRFVLTVLVFCLAASALAQDGDPYRTEDSSLTVPKSKQTTLGLYLTASEAYAKWKAAPEQVIVIDVRTPEEYVFVGHPEMAWNIPVRLNVHEVNGEDCKLTMKPNDNFVRHVTRIADPSDTILLICRSGGRSAAATNLLAEEGFKHVYNIIDGFEGDRIDDPESVFNGKRMKNGWRNAGLPWTYDVAPGKMRLPVEHHVEE